MGLFKRFSEFISYPSHSRTIGLLAFLVVLLAIPLTVNIAQKQQELRQRAAFEGGGGNVRSCYPPAQAPSNCTLDTNQNPPCDPIVLKTGAQGEVIYQNWFLCGNARTGPGSSSQSGCDKAGGQCVDQSYVNANPGGTIISASCYAGDLVCYKSGSKTAPVGSDADSICASNGGECVDTCTNSTVAPGTCTKGRTCCLKIGAPGSGGTATCDSQGGTCYPNPDAAARANAIPITGICASGACYKAGTGVCPSTGGWTGETCSKEGSTEPVTVTPGQSCTVRACQREPGAGKLCWFDDTSKVYNDPVGCGFSTSPSTPASNAPTGIALSCPGTSHVCPSPLIAVKIQSSGNWACVDTKTGSFSSTNPTCSASANGTKISFTIGLDGIGSAGDQKNPNPNPAPGCNPASGTSSCGSNQNPKRPTRKLFYQIFDQSKANVLEEGQTSISYSGGKFTNTITLKNTLPDGTYPIKVRAEAYLARLTNVTIANNAGSVSSPNLVTGSSTETNRISILDYNNLLGCMFKGQVGNTVCQLMDLNDDGVVDQLDYNLFVREFAVVQQGD